MSSEDKALAIMCGISCTFFGVGLICRAYVIVHQPTSQESSAPKFLDAEFSYNDLNNPCIRVKKEGEIREIDLWELSK